MQWLHWLGTYQSRNVLEAAKNSSSKLIKFCKIFFFNGIFYWLTDSLTPSDKRNSIMGGSTDFIPLLENVAWFGHVPFDTPLLLKCVHYECTFVSRNISFILSEYGFFSVSQLHSKILEYTCNKIKSRVLSSVAVSDWTLLVLTIKVYISRMSYIVAIVFVL